MLFVAVALPLSHDRFLNLRFHACVLYVDEIMQLICQLSLYFT